METSVADVADCGLSDVYSTTAVGLFQWHCAVWNILPNYLLCVGGRASSIKVGG